MALILLGWGWRTCSRESQPSKGIKHINVDNCTQCLFTCCQSSCNFPHDELLTYCKEFK